MQYTYKTPQSFSHTNQQQSISNQPSIHLVEVFLEFLLQLYDVLLVFYLLLLHVLLLQSATQGGGN